MRRTGRRRFVLGALGTAATLATGALLRPTDSGAAYGSYFRRLNQLLRARGPGRPVLVIDLDRLERNCQRLRTSVAAGKGLRIVAKSLPSPALLGHVLERTGTTRLMSFHQPFLSALAQQLPSCDVLLGKPMPLRAAETFYRTLPAGSTFEPSRQLQWLIDTPERLLQYQQLARNLGTRFNVNLELDVGLHRGGVSDTRQLDSLLATLASDPAHLRLSGFMGYDAHVGKLPALVESRATSLAKANRTYADYVARARQRHPQLMAAGLTLNGAGSPTFRLHDARSPLNEVSVGSALVKPSDFDLELLHDFEPAAWIATPVLKVQGGLSLPGAEWLGRAWAAWDPNRRRTAFIYGGRWLASWEAPGGLRDNEVYGRSSNQAIVNASLRAGLHVDDYVFLRPTQSEAVLLQFGDLVAVRGGEIEAHWPVLAPAHDAV